MSALVVEYFGDSGVRRVEVVGAHPYADRFPMLPADELQRLAEDIRENGQRNPIMVSLDGLILDGRNRLAACQMLDIEPDLEVCGFEDVAAYILSANVARRHQSTGSRAMSTALVLADDGRRENGRWKRGSVVANPEIRNSAWSDLMLKAGAILDHAPDLAGAVVAGTLALDAAHREAEQRRDAERRKLEEAERLAAEEADAQAFILDHAPDLAARVDGRDLLTYVEARDLWARRNREEAARQAAEKARKAADERDAQQGAEHQCAAFADALATLDYLTSAPAFERSFADWERGSIGARPAARALRTPAKLREIADALNRYADRLENR